MTRKKQYIFTRCPLCKDYDDRPAGLISVCKKCGEFIYMDTYGTSTLISDEELEVWGYSYLDDSCFNLNFYADTDPLQNLIVELKEQLNKKEVV